MTQKKYVRLGESTHFRVRLLAAALNRSAPELCELLIDNYLDWLGVSDDTDLSVSALKQAAERLESRPRSSMPQAFAERLKSVRA